MKPGTLIIFTIAVSGMLLSSFVTFSNTDAQIFYSSSYSPTTIPLSDVYSITTKQVKYNIPYNVTNGTVDEIISYCESGSIVIRITSSDSGKLVIDIPRNLLDMKYGSEDKEFIVLLDGEETGFDETRHTYSREYGILLPAGSKEIEIIGTFSLSDNMTNVSCETIHNPPYSHILPPLKQMKNDIHPEDVMCEPNLVKVHKLFSMNSTACVKHATKQHLMDRGWGAIAPLEKIREEPGMIKNNVVEILDGHVVYLYPSQQCYSISVDKLGEYDIKRYESEGLGFKDIFELKQKDLNDLPVVEELIYGTQQIKPLLNDESRVGMSIKEFVDYETFLMNKSIAKYEDSQGDYFRSFDIDFNRNPEENHTFENDFESPWIVYNSTIYEVRGTTFMIDDLDEPRYFILYPRNDSNHHKFVVLDEDDMESVPLLRQAMAEIGTMTESVTAFKGVDKETKSHYNDWFYKNLNSDWVFPKSHMFKHDYDFYSIEFNWHCT